MAAITMRFRRLLPIFVAVLVILLSLLGTPTSAVAQTNKCYGAGCNGLNPTGRCDDDAMTVASMAVPSLGGGFAGQLDLRYSPSCKANWGRFTPYQRNFLGAIVGTPISIYGRVTVWNLGKISQQPIHDYSVARTIGSNWTYMVDGTTTACTGVEIMQWQKNPYNNGSPDDLSEGKTNEVPSGGSFDSEGWTWGPCV